MFVQPIVPIGFSILVEVANLEGGMVQFTFRHLTFPGVRHLIAIPEPWKTEVLFVDCGRRTFKEKGGTVLCAKGKCTNGGNTFGDQHGPLFAVSPSDARLTSKHRIKQLPLLYY